MSLLDIRNLFVSFPTEMGDVKAVNGVDLSLNKGDVFALLGESGCGKTVLGTSIIRLLPKNSNIQGHISYKNRNIMKLSEKEMRSIRGTDIGMIMQNPESSLNPVLKVGYQISEGLRIHKKLNRKTAHEKSIELLKRVRIHNPEKVVSQYPHELSGGMKERALIAMGVAAEPSFIIADEPTKGLDPTVKYHVMNLIYEVSRNKTFLLITHDLYVAKSVCTHIGVMYAGEIVETAPADDMSDIQYHPYTKGFFASHPSEGLRPIQGNSPSLINPPNGCRFHPRCAHCSDLCKTEHPPMVPYKGHMVRCFLYD